MRANGRPRLVGFVVPSAANVAVVIGGLVALAAADCRFLAVRRVGLPTQDGVAQATCRIAVAAADAGPVSGGLVVAPARDRGLLADSAVGQYGVAGCVVLPTEDSRIVAHSMVAIWVFRAAATDDR